MYEGSTPLSIFRSYLINVKLCKVAKETDRHFTNDGLQSDQFLVRISIWISMHEKKATAIHITTLTENVTVERESSQIELKSLSMTREQIY